MYRIWYSTESFADYLIEHTTLRNEKVIKAPLCESDASKPEKFHAIPDHIKKILYLDAPDIIIEKDDEPVLSIEESQEAGTGHNAFQRFARIAAAVENKVPAFYIYPEAAIISRRDCLPRWDAINPAVFKALEATMDIYGIPAMLFYYPSDYSAYRNSAQCAPHLRSKGLVHDARFLSCPDSSDAEMQSMFAIINEIVGKLANTPVKKVQKELIGNLLIRARKGWMAQEFAAKADGRRENEMSPLSSVIQVPTDHLLAYLSQYEKNGYVIGSLLRGRDETIIYHTDSKFRGDPFPGALAAIDYMRCREGETFEDRKFNLVLLFGKVEDCEAEGTLKVSGEKSSIKDFVQAVQNSSAKNLLTKEYSDLKAAEIPRYYMQVRYGSTYSKAKHIRVYSYFADAIIFPDGALWRDA